LTGWFLKNYKLIMSFYDKFLNLKINLNKYKSSKIYKVMVEI